MLDGEVEADESYFGGTRKGKRGRGAAGKTAVFGLLNAMVRFIPLPYPIHSQPLYCPLYEKK